MNKLKTWMDRRGMGNVELAQELGVSYEYAYKLSTGKSNIGDGVKWKFGQVFGFDLAQELFGDDPAASHEPTESLDPTPEPEPAHAYVYPAP